MLHRSLFAFFQTAWFIRNALRLLVAGLVLVLAQLAFSHTTNTTPENDVVVAWNAIVENVKAEDERLTALYESLNRYRPGRILLTPELRAEQKRRPLEITIGETLEFEKDFADFPADEWTVIYYLRGAGTGIDIAGTPDGTTHCFTAPTTDTDNLTAGLYYYQAIATKDGEKHKVDEGTTTAIASLAALNTSNTYDGRSNAKKIVDAIDAMMDEKATADQKRYKIGAAGSERELERLTMSELLEARKFYAKIVNAENRRKKKTPFKTIGIQFENAQ
jgi:hypothetical protein